MLSNGNPGANELTDPTGKADAVALKFDGIGNGEDLIVVLDLKDASGNEITKSLVIDNSDIIKTNAAVPTPWNTEFSLDNNDGLVIIEHNDYDTAAGTLQIQGIQIMQSQNGLTGTGINFNEAVGVNGGSSGSQIWGQTANGTTANSNDVLKITDIGFVESVHGTQDAALNFQLQVVDGDGDTAPVPNACRCWSTRRTTRCMPEPS